MVQNVSRPQSFVKKSENVGGGQHSNTPKKQNMLAGGSTAIVKIIEGYTGGANPRDPPKVAENKKKCESLAFRSKSRPNQNPNAIIAFRSESIQKSKMLRIRIKKYAKNKNDCESLAFSSKTHPNQKPK